MNRSIKVAFSLLLAVVVVVPLSAQRGRVAMAYYDVERLYDTIPSPHYDDRPYTPEGRMRWGSDRYNLKVERVAAVLDSMALPIVALFGVESLDVTRDIVSRSSGEYSFLHRNLDYYDGLDFALLYYGDLLTITDVQSNNHTLHICAELLGEPLLLILTRRPDKLHTFDRSVGQCVVMGSFTSSRLASLGLEDPFAALQRAGGGDRYGERGWYMGSRIGFYSENLDLVDSGVYITKWLLDSEKRAPYATFSKSGYLGGYSSSLPIFILFEGKEK